MPTRARLSELLNTVFQGIRAIGDEFDSAPAPKGESWEELVGQALPDSAEPGPPPTFVRTVARADHPAPVHPESGASNAPGVEQTLPADPATGSSLTPTGPGVTGAAAIPAAATPKELTEGQRREEWWLIVHYMDTRAPMTDDQLVRAHAAFGRWFGWALSVEEMREAREISRTVFRLTGSTGPWTSPFSALVWAKAVRGRSIATIKELKKTDWANAGRLASYVGVTLRQEDKPKPKPAEAAKDAAGGSGRPTRAAGRFAIAPPDPGADAMDVVDLVSPSPSLDLGADAMDVVDTVPAPPGSEQQQALVGTDKTSAGEGAGRNPAVPTVRVGRTKGKSTGSAVARYNYDADVTLDPRANALIAYILAAWETNTKTTLVRDADAMRQLGVHATAAVPALVEDSKRKQTTRGLFRWNDLSLPWELALEYIDWSVKERAEQKSRSETSGG